MTQKKYFSTLSAFLCQCALQYYKFYLRLDILLAISTETNLLSNALFQKFALISFYAAFFFSSQQVTIVA